jgi:hypothetical protein
MFNSPGVKVRVHYLRRNFASWLVDVAVQHGANYREGKCERKSFLLRRNKLEQIF